MTQFTRRLQHLLGSGAAGATGAITNGGQLIGQLAGLTTNVGPNALLKSGSYPVPAATTHGPLTAVAAPGGGTWRIDNPSHANANITPFTSLWGSPTQVYVNSDSPSNLGGIVPSGGMTIDGFSVPAGTYVIQFMELSAGDFLLSDWTTPLLFRGCRWRGPVAAPGIFNAQVEFNQPLWLHYCDFGGHSSADADVHEVPVDTGGNCSEIRCYRDYVSYTTSGLQPNVPGHCDIIENFVEKLTLFGGLAGLAGQSGPYHLNGITLNGGNTSCRILRNHVVIVTPDEAGNDIDQTDCISLFQDFGTFPGNGVNRDGTMGYWISGNYVGGTGYPIYFGQNGGTAPNTVNNVNAFGNLVTTAVYSTGGINGPATAIPTWGSFGNAESGNVWADGPNAGVSFL